MATLEKYIPEEKIVDLCNHGLYYLTIPSDCNSNTVVLLDHNKIRNFENIVGNRDIILQLSVANNCLLTLKGISNFRKLCVLNLSSNFIDKIEDLSELKSLTWLNLSGNQIKTIENLDKNVSLEHLDLSYNGVQILGNLSHLHRLKSLLLHGNLITSFKNEVGYFPANLLTLSLAENDITDIKQISHLSFVSHLEQLSVMGNPCARSMDKTKYNNYILSCCKNLKVLDGAIIQNTATPLEKHSISTLNDVCSTKPTQLYSSSISTESLMRRAKSKTSSILFPGSLQKEESIFKKNLLAVSYSTGSPEKISYQSEQDVTLQEDEKGERFSTLPNFLCSSMSLKVNSSNESANQHNHSEMESVRHSKETVCTDSWNRIESKYEAYDNRPVRPMSKNFYKAISDTSYLSCSPPQPSVKEPVISNKKKMHQEFVSQTFDCDESSGQDTGDKSSQKKITGVFEKKPFLMKGARKQHKTALNSVTKNVVKPPETQNPKRDPDLSTRQKCGLNDQLKDKSANENLLKGSENILDSSSSSADQSLNTKNITIRNKEVKTISNQPPTFTSFGTNLLSSTIPTTIESGFESQSNFHGTLTVHQAATQIQALWRGFQCRNLNPHTKHAYMELRCRRAQQHITKLSSDLQQQKDICDQKNSLLKQFLEIFQILLKELQLNKDTKEGDLSLNLLSKSPCKNYGSEQPQTTSNTQIESLQQTCHTLNMQVKHLHETLHTFMMGNFFCHQGNNPDHPELHLSSSGQNSPGTAADPGYWSYILEDQASHGINDFKEESTPDITPDSCSQVSVPDCLTLLPLSENSIMLSWSPSTIKTIDDSISHTLLGYKIYVNDRPMAFVPANKTQLIISNLNIHLTYTIYVTTISTLRESNESQKLIANYCMKNAAKERNVLHSDVIESKSSPEVNQTLNRDINSDHSKDVSKDKSGSSSSDFSSNPTDSNCKHSSAFEHKKPTVAEVVEQRFRECSKNVSPSKDSGISPQQKYRPLKTTTSLENMAGCFKKEANRIHCSQSATQQKDAASVFSDDEDPLAEPDRTGERMNDKLINLLEKLYSFSVLQNKAQSPSKYRQPESFSSGKISRISETPDIVEDNYVQNEKLSASEEHSINQSYSSTESCRGKFFI